MSTSTAPHIETSSAGRGGVLRFGAAAALCAALVAGYLALGSLTGFSPAQPAIDQGDVAVIQADPFQQMTDLTPVIAAEQARTAVNTDPFQVMIDLTPVVAADHARTIVVGADPFPVMTDLTPVISEMLTPQSGSGPPLKD